LHPDDLAVDDRDMEKLRANQPVISEIRTLTQSGKTVWVRVYAHPVLDAERKELVGIYGAVQDITERKRAEIELQSIYAASQRLQRLYAPDELAREMIAVLESIAGFEYGAVLLIDEEQNILMPFAISDQRRGPEFEKMDRAYVALRKIKVGTGITGWVAEKGQSVRLGDVRQDPRYLAMREDIRSELCVPLKLGERTIGVVNMETRRPNAYDDSDQRVLETVSAQMTVAIQNARLLEQVQRHAAELEQRVAERTADLYAALTKTEALYHITRSLITFESLSDMLQAVVDRIAETLPANRVTLITLDQEASRVTQFMKGGPGSSQVVQVSFDELMHGLAGWVLREQQPAISPKGSPDPRESLEVQRRRVETNCGAIVVVPLRYLDQTLGIVTAINTPDEPDFAVRDRELMETMASQAALAIIKARLYANLQDANKALEQRAIELKAAMEQAQEADRLKSAFLATMSHELRTPLNSIIGFTGVLLQKLAGPLNDEQVKQLAMVQISAHHLLALINDVLDISKIEAGQIEIVKQPFDMRLVIEEALRTTGPLAAKKGLSLVAAIASDVGLMVSDRRRVEQILLNLVNNAIKFTEHGEVRVECRIQDGWLETRVRDAGIGIKPEDMDKLFQPFRQIETGLARRHEGTGLGLSICQKLVLLLGGKIGVESEWGVGSTFTFTLPVSEEAR
jgi:signal transduction histidine kinase/putative methionine-R-sulfoxide reductase with GAF domain